MDRLGDLGADVVDASKFLFAGGDEGVDAAEFVGESLRGALADVANAEAEENAIQRGLL